MWTEEFPVRTWDVDRTGRLHVAAAFNYFQEIAGNHAEYLGVGKDALEKTGHAWVLSRMTAIIDRRPQWGEVLQARTWPRGTDRLFAVRDYELVDSQNKIVGRGRSGWVVLDTCKMRPVRPQFLTDTIPAHEDMRALSHGIASLKAFENLRPAGSRIASYSDIDYNGHVNNARYIQWMQDVLPSQELEDASTFHLDINYLSQVVPASSIDFFTAPQHDSDGKSFHAFEGRQGESSSPAFRAELRM